MARHLGKPLRVIYSHIVPHWVDMVDVRESVEREMHNGEEELSDYDFSGNESIDVDSNNDSGSWEDLDRIDKALNSA